MKRIAITFLIIAVCLPVSGLIIVLQDSTVVGVHSDTETVTFQAYPEANQIKKVENTVQVKVGDSDPTGGTTLRLWRDAGTSAMIVAHLTATKTELDLTNPNDSLTLTGVLRATTANDSQQIPIRETWDISLFHEDGDREVFRVSVYGGQFVKNLTSAVLPKSGQWYIDETRFYQVLLPSDLGVFANYSGAALSAFPFEPYSISLKEPFIITTYK